MEIFNLPLNTTHLRHQLKWLSYVTHSKFWKYKKLVDTILSDPDLGKVWTRRRIIARLLEKYGINDQRSSQWHTKRSEMITASEVTKAFHTATPSARREMLLKKIEGSKPGDGSGMNAACAWGTNFEPIAKTIYCTLNGGGHVVDTSCVVHPFYPFLGASPDGIYFTESTNDPRWGKLIEFKCPISRKFDNDSAIPDSYYHQMQMQMECTNIDECDYVEMQFSALPQFEWEKMNIQFKGRFAVYDDGHVDYDTNETSKWKINLKKRSEDYRIVHWILVMHRIKTVKRDYKWLPSHIEELKGFWEEVLFHRNNGTVPLKEDKGLLVCNLPIDSPDDQCSPQQVDVQNQMEVDDSSFVHKKNTTTLQFCLDLDDQ